MLDLNQVLADTNKLHDKIMEDLCNQHDEITKSSKSSSYADSVCINAAVMILATTFLFCKYNLEGREKRYTQEDILKLSGEIMSLMFDKYAIEGLKTITFDIPNNNAESEHNDYTR